MKISMQDAIAEYGLSTDEVKAGMVAATLLTVALTSALEDRELDEGSVDLAIHIIKKTVTDDDITIKEGVKIFEENDADEGIWATVIRHFGKDKADE